MNRILALAFPLVILAGAALTLAALEARRTPDWQSELNAYIAHTRTPGETVTVRMAVEAGRPENFRADMAKSVESEKGYSMWATGAAPAGRPAALHCVLLDRERPAADEAERQLRQVLYIGSYDDGLWQVGWMVYQAPQESSTVEPQTRANLDAVGCDLGIK